MKKGQALLGVGLVIVVLLLAAIAYGVMKGGGISIPTLNSATTNIPSGGCSDAAGLTINCVDKYTSASQTLPLFYKVDGGAAIKGTCGTEITNVVAGKTVEYMINGTDSTYYGAHGVTAPINCGPNPVSVKIAQKVTSPTIQLYSADDGTLNTASAKESLPANSQDVQTVKVIGQYQEEMQGATFVIDYLKTNVDAVTSNLPLSSSEPDYFLHRSGEGVTAPTKFALIDLGDLSSSQVKEFTFTFDIGATTYSGANATMQLVDKEWYLDQNGGFAYGYEEPEANINVGIKGNFSTLMYTDS